MIVDICSHEELTEFAAISAYLKEVNNSRRRKNHVIMRCHYTAKRKPKDVKLMLFNVGKRVGIASF